MNLSVEDMSDVMMTQLWAQVLLLLGEPKEGGGGDMYRATIVCVDSGLLQLRES